MGNVTREPFADQAAIDNLRPEPRAPETFSGLIGRSAAAERVENYVSGIRSELNASRRNHRLEFVHMPTRFDLVMPRGRRIIPEVRQIQSERVQVLSVTAVIFHVLFAVAALWDWKPHGVAIKRLRRAFREIEKSVMRGIKLLTAREGALHGNCDPMPE